MRAKILLPAALLLTVALPAQRLRLAVEAADVVAVATDIGVRPLGRDHLLHTLRPDHVLRGEIAETSAQLSVLEVRGVSLHQRPRPGETRLYCLHDCTELALEAGLPQERAPYFKMSGHAGSNPALGDRSDPTDEPSCQLAQLVLDSEAGTSPRELAGRLLQLALFSPVDSIRIEAVELFTERAALSDALHPLQRSQLRARAVGETEDIDFKIALATLCAEQRAEGLVDALCMSMGEIDDVRFARALGRIARHLHGDDAIEVLQRHIVRPPAPAARDRLLLTLGATHTERALKALLRMREMSPDDRAVEAALREHGAPQALAVLEK